MHFRLSQNITAFAFVLIFSHYFQEAQHCICEEQHLIGLPQHKVHKLPSLDVPRLEFLHLVFTRMPGDIYRRRLRSTSLLLYLCYVFRALINSLVC